MSIRCSCSGPDPSDVRRGLSLILLLQRKVVLRFRAFATFLPAEDFSRAPPSAPRSSSSLSHPRGGSTSSAALADGECPASAALGSHHVLSLLLRCEWKGAASQGWRSLLSLFRFKAQLGFYSVKRHGEGSLNFLYLLCFAGL